MLAGNILNKPTRRLDLEALGTPSKSGPRRRIAFADKVDPDILWIGYLTPPPGSPHWADGIKRGWIDPKNMDMLKA